MPFSAGAAGLASLFSVALEPESFLNRSLVASPIAFLGASAVLGASALGAFSATGLTSLGASSFLAGAFFTVALPLKIEALRSSESDALDALIDNNYISHRPDLDTIPLT